MNKIITIMLVTQLLLKATGMPVTDLGSYAYYVEQINQMTKMINGMNKQIQTLGGVKTSVEDMKGSINDAKSTLEGALDSLESAKNDLDKTFSNMEIKSLFDLDAPRTTVSGGGVAYKDISKIITDTMTKADESIINFFGGKSAFIKAQKGQDKLIKALNASSLADFKNALNKDISNKDISNYKNKLLVKDYIKGLKRMNAKSKELISAKLISEEWRSTVFPDIKDKQKRDKDKKRLKDLIKYVESAKDLKQSVKTTNMILLEIVSIQNKDYLSALNFRNAMTAMFLRNGNNEEFLKELQTRQKDLPKARKLPKSISESSIYNMRTANPYGVGWRPAQ